MSMPGDHQFNRAAVREVLMKIAELYGYSQAVLETTARNCDLYRHLGEALEAFWVFNGIPGEPKLDDMPSRVLRQFLYWIFEYHQEDKG